MSSSRILSSRPSASCITAKPIARTIRGRGRNAPPFFAAQKRESRAGFSARAAGVTCALWLCRPGNRTVHCWAQWGRWAFPHRPTGSGKAEGAFPAEPAGGTALCLSVPETAWLIAGALALLRHPAGSGKAERAFPPEPLEALALWLSVPETAQSIAGALWGNWRFRTTQPGMEAMP